MNSTKHFDGALFRRCRLYDIVVRCLGWRFDVSPFGTEDDGRSLRVAFGTANRSTSNSPLVDATCLDDSSLVSPQVLGEYFEKLFFVITVMLCERLTCMSVN